MGHRKKSAPRRGSLAYRPRARASRILPRVRNWPSVDEVRLLGFPAYKAGMIHVITIDDRQTTPNFGKPLFNASTVLACPPAFLLGFRAYVRDAYGLKSFSEVYSDKLPKDLDRKVRIKPNPDALKKIEENLDRIECFRAILYTRPKDAGLSQKKPFVFEVGVGGGVKEQFEYLKSKLGKELRVGEVFKPGSYVDTIGITKGKGFEGPITRFGVKRKHHKSRKTVRAVAVIGPWHPASVMYTVPMAGQMGFHQRTEYNKRVLAIGSASPDNPFPPNGFFEHFGVIRTDYVILRGSVQGPPKRLVILRESIRAKGKVKEPKIIEVSVG